MRRSDIVLTLGISVLVLAFPPAVLAGDGASDAQVVLDDDSPGLLDIVLRELKSMVGLDGADDSLSPFTDDNGWDIHDSHIDDPGGPPEGQVWIDGITVDEEPVSDDNGWDLESNVVEGGFGEVEGTEIGGPIAP